MPLSLYQKYRPDSFDKLIGQEHIIRILQAEIANNKISHAYIFIGPRGTGKTTTARIFANAVNCLGSEKHAKPCGKCKICKAAQKNQFVDLIEIDAASNRGVDNIRELREKIGLAPVMGKYKVYIIDEVHMLTKEAFNALLKTLEEPPEHVIFILATTEPHKVPATIMSRCERFVFHLADDNKLLSLLDRIAKNENIEVQDKAKQLLISQANGSFRDLLSVLDPIFSSAKQKNNVVTYQDVVQLLGLFDNVVIYEFLQAVFSFDLSKINTLLSKVIATSGNITAFMQAIIDVLREEIKIYHDTKKFSQNLTNNGKININYKNVVKLLSLFIQYLSEIRFIYSDRLALEIVVYEYFAWLDNLGANTNISINTNNSSLSNQQISKKEKYNAPAVDEINATYDNKPIANQVLEEYDSDRDNEPKSTIKIQDSTNKSNSSLSLQTVKKNWNKVLAHIKQIHGPLYAILSTSVISGVSQNNNITQINVHVKYEYHKKKLEHAKTRQLLSEVLNDIYGTMCNIVATVNKNIKITNIKPEHSTDIPPVDKSKIDTKDNLEHSQTREDPVASVFGDALEV